MKTNNYIIPVLISLFFLLQPAVQGQNFKSSERVEQDNIKSLEKLWRESTFKWEKIRMDQNNKEAKAGEIFSPDAEKTMIRFMGFDKNGHPVYYQTYNLFGAQTLNTDHLWGGGVTEFDLNGEDMLLHVWDGGKVRSTHQEFGDRVTQMDDDGFISPHSTHVAGTMIAAGLIPTAKGMSPEAELHAYTFSDDETEMIEAAANGALISNHSYGRPTGWVFHTNQWWWYGDTRISTTEDYKFGFYDEETRVRDEITYLAPYYLQVHAAGNDQIDLGPAEGEEHNVFDHDLEQWIKSTDPRERDGGEEGLDIISSLVLGKNVLTVGSIGAVTDYSDPSNVVLSEFSSTGPTDDGRIKPDLVAKGQGVLSTWVDSDQSYAGLNGTSMAAPSIAGSLSLLQQFNKRLYGQYLRASTLKALVIHTAREAGNNPGPDYIFGWGLPDFDAAASILPEKDNTTIIQERNLVAQTVPSYSRTVYSNGSEPLVATLVWTDVPGEAPAPALNDRTPILVNDLDVKITRLSDNQEFYPWKLDPDNPLTAASKGDNIVDNVEKIEVTLPEPGEYLVEVTHKGNLVDLVNEENKRQSFSLIISGIAERSTDLAVTNADVLTSGCNFTENTPASITLENKGQQAADNILVNYIAFSIAGDTLTQGNYTVETLEPGNQDITEVFLDLSVGFEFELRAFIDHPGDLLPANDEFTRNLISESWQVSENPYQDSFEGIVSETQNGWQVWNENNDLSSWMLRVADGENEFATDGANTMRYGILNPVEDGTETSEQADDWLISGCFYLLPEENYRLSFDYRAWTEESAESMRVFIGQIPEPGAFSEIIWESMNFTNEDFITVQEQFTVESEGNYHIAFQVVSEPDHRFLYMDNVRLERMVFNDLAASDITVDASSCSFSSETPVTVSFNNMGLHAQENFDVTLEVYHLTTEQTFEYTQTYSGSLAADNSGELTFLADMSLYGEYELQLSTGLIGDERPDNNAQSTGAFNSLVDLEVQSFFTNFDGLENEQDIKWTILNINNDPHTWRHYGVSGQSYSQPNSMNFYRGSSSDGPGITNDWLITNCLKMEEGNTYRISFQTSTQGTGDVDEYQIYLMEGLSADDTLSQFGNVFIDKFEYSYREYIVEAPYTGIFYIGFYVSTDPPNSTQSFIDDVTIEKAENFDLSLESINQITYGCDGFSTETPVEVVIKNRGINPVEEAILELSATPSDGGAGNLYEFTYQGTFNSQQMDTVEFLIDLSELNTIYDIAALVIHPDDEKESNNVLTSQIRNTQVDLTSGDLYFNDFEMTTVDGHIRLMDPFMGWWYENANNDFSSPGNPITWVLRKNERFALSGEISVRSGRNTESPANDWLFSNCFEMDQDENYLLTFEYTGHTSSLTEKMAVYLGTAQTSEAMTQILWEDEFNTSIDYSTAHITFSPPEDGTYYIGFHHFSDADQGWAFIDDFSMVRNYDLDIALDSIIVNTDPCQISEQTPLRISYKNTGNAAFDQPVTLTYHIIAPDGSVAGTGELTQQEMIAVNQKVYFDFNADMRKYGKYTIEAMVSFDDETEENLTANNSLTLEYINTSMYPDVENIYISLEDYESMDRTGFSSVDNNGDGFSWDLGTSFTNFSYSGKKVLYYTFNDDQPADDWLFSSCANLSANTVYNVSFYYRVYSGDYPENMKFAIASSPHPDDVIQILDEKDEMVNYNFRRSSYAFTVPEDGQYFFAWHAYSNAWQRFMFVDDLTVRVANDTDGSVENIISSVLPCAYSNETPMEIHLSNLGSQILPAGEINLVIDNGTSSEEISVSTPAIDPLGKELVSFLAPMTGQGRTHLHYDLIVDNDQFLSNNSGSETLFRSRVDLTQPGSWFIQDFETIFSLQETDWDIFNVNNDNRYWGLRVDDPGLSNSGHNYLVYFTGNTSFNANDWVISGCYELNELLSYKAVFFYRLGSGSHQMRLAAGNAAHPDSLTQVIWEDTQMQDQGNGYVSAGNIFKPDNSSDYHFGIQQYSLMGQGSSLADDLIVIAQPLIAEPDFDEHPQPGSNITLQAIGTDSLRWYLDEELTQLLAEGRQAEFTMTGDSMTIYAAERVLGVHGPYDSINIGAVTNADQTNYLLDMNVYPNPANSHITVEFSENSFSDGTYKIVNVLGEILLSGDLPPSNVSTIDINTLMEGFYTLILEKENSTSRHTFVKE